MRFNAAKLEWSKHFATMANKVNSKFLVLHCNLQGCPEQTAYFSLIHSFIEFADTLCDDTRNTTARKLKGCSIKLQGLLKACTLVFLICLMC